MPTSSDTNSMRDLPPTDGEFEELAIAEEELIDAYLRNELSADERKLFENALQGSSELRERLHFARLLGKEVSMTPQPQTVVSQIQGPSRQSDVEFRGLRKWRHFFGASFMPQPAFRLALGTCVVLILLGGAALLAGWMNLRRESQRLAAERISFEQERQALEKRVAEQQSSSEQLTAEMMKERQQLEEDRKGFEELRRVQIAGEKSQSQTPAGIIATLLITPGLMRGPGGPAELLVAPGTSKIKLELGLEAVEYTKYRAVIKDARGGVIARSNLRASRTQKFLTLQLPAARFPAGDYILHLSGLTSVGAVEPVSDYPFRIRSKK